MCVLVIVFNAWLELTCREGLVYVDFGCSNAVKAL